MGTSVYVLLCPVSWGELWIPVEANCYWGSWKGTLVYKYWVSVKEKEPNKHCPHGFWCLLLQSRVKLLEKITKEHERYSANVNQFQSWLNDVTERLNCCIGEATKSSAEDKLKALKVVKQYNSAKEPGLCVLHAYICFSNHARVYLRKDLHKQNTVVIVTWARGEELYQVLKLLVNIILPIVAWVTGWSAVFFLKPDLLWLCESLRILPFKLV